MLNQAKRGAPEKARAGDVPPFPGMPVWAKVFAVLVLLVGLLFVHRLLGFGARHALHGAHGPTAPSPARDEQTSSEHGH